jgi:formamidopyrimidine-DNA glycosylase
MPELPDVELYLHALRNFIGGQSIDGIALRSPFLVRSVDPSLESVVGRQVVGLRRLGKRIVWELEGDLFLVFHLMIAGRYHWKKPGVKPTRKVDLAAFHFAAGTLMMTEASSKKRASLHVVSGVEGVKEHDPGGLEVLECDEDEFKAALTRQNHTLKRTLTDPRVFSGIGNAYSDEILHAARLSPVKWTSRLSVEEISSLYVATRDTMIRWTEMLKAECGDEGFPEKVTAFKEGMAAHGRYGKPCPVCDTPIQEIVYAANETNYCPRCQTGGKVLADRLLSRLLKDDWPKTIEEAEELRGRMD